MQAELRQALIDQAQSGSTTTYKALADRLGLQPPQTIHRLSEALEILMQDDVAAGRPMLAALCVSRTGSGIPASGFFRTAEALGVFSGASASPQAFHADEVQRVLAFYGPAHPRGSQP